MFTEPSKKTQEFVKNKLNILPAFHLSKKSKQFLKRLREMALAAPPPTYTKKQLQILPRGYLLDNLEIDEIKTYILNLNKINATHIHLRVKNRIYNLYFVLPHGSAPIDIERCVFKINQWLHVATSFADRACSTQVDVYLYLTDFVKRLPHKFGQPIGKENVNTAFTTGCSSSTEIIIFRREEWFKVFMHESMHNLGLDFNLTTKSLLKSIFPLENSNCSLRETYAEMWAEIFNILLMTESEEDAIQIERKFSLFQAAKILDYFDLNYVELFEKTAESERLRQTNYKETSEVFCYYIVRALLLYNCNDFIEWVATNCNGGIKFDETKVEKFIRELIIPKYNQIKFVKLIDDVQSKHFDKPPRDVFLKNNLRMTAIEMP